jgi:hypothetical protein
LAMASGLCDTVGARCGGRLETGQSAYFLFLEVGEFGAMSCPIASRLRARFVDGMLDETMVFVWAGVWVRNLTGGPLTAEDRRSTCSNKLNPVPLLLPAAATIH